MQKQSHNPVAKKPQLCNRSENLHNNHCVTQTTFNHSFNSKMIFVRYFYFIQYYTKETGRVILLTALMSSQGTCSSIRSSMIHSKCVVLLHDENFTSQRSCASNSYVHINKEGLKCILFFFLESSKLFHLLWRGSLHSS